MNPIIIKPRDDFMQQPGSFQLRRKMIEILVRSESNPNALLELQDLMEEVLRKGCEIENGTWEEALEQMSASEADQLFQQILQGSPTANFTTENWNPMPS